MARKLVGRVTPRRKAVDPIQKMEAVEAIKELTKTNPRNYLLFVAGINSGLRAADLIRLRVGQVRGLKPGDSFSIKETKRGKENVFVVNEAIHDALCFYFAAYPNLSDDAYLFFSKQGSHILSQRVGDLVQEWCKKIGLNGGRYGAHTLRKAWGYMNRVHMGVAWEVICDRYGHDSPATTRAYLGLKRAETTKALMNWI